MGFPILFPVFSCSASSFMRQLNKAVNAWGSLRGHHTQQIFTKNKDTEQKKMTNAATKAKK